jgi:hypothetical protein
MPNHIDNNVLIVATDELVKQIRDEIRGDDTDSNTGEVACIDFDKIIPMPKELEGTRSPAQILTTEEYEAQEERKVVLIDLIDKCSDKDELRKLQVELDHSLQGITSEMRLELKRKYGHDNWYDWSVANTGTKWGAYSCIGGDDSDNFFFFQTAWAHPQELMIALSEKYPEAIFVSTFADEDTGSNCGAIAYKDGEVNFEDGSIGTHDRNFATAFAYAVNYGDEGCENIDMGVEEEWIEKEDAEQMIKVLKSDHQLIKVARELNEENAKFLTDMF